MANKRKAGVTDGELAKRLADHLINGGMSKDEAWERATVYYNSHHCTKSKEEQEKDQKIKDQKEFLRQMEEAKANKDQTFEVAAEGEEHQFFKA
jgi:hypothetical protein